MALRLVWSQPHIPSRTARFRAAMTLWATESAQQIEHQQKQWRNAMHAIKSLDIVSRAEVRELAQAAADRGDNQHDANPFPLGSANALHFEHDYQERARELCEA